MHVGRGWTRCAERAGGPDAAVPRRVHRADLAACAVLVMGAILVPGRRAVASALRVVGLEHLARFSNYHRGAQPQHMVQRLAVAPPAPLARRHLRPQRRPGGDRPRRWGARTKAGGVYRDPVRSSHGRFVKASGLRWLSLMPPPEIPWAGRRWALPFLIVLVPSERFWQEHKSGTPQHKKLTDWGGQVLIKAALWLPHRRIIGVGDTNFAAIDLLNEVRPWVTVISRLRLEAALHKPAPKRVPGKAGRPPVAGKRQFALKRRLVDPKTRWRRLLVTPRARPAGRTRTASLSLHRSRCRPARHSALVHPPLVDRGHLRRGPPPPRCGDPTAMVRSGNRPHHASPAQLVLPDHALGQ
jgi:hypothetical protein